MKKIILALFFLIGCVNVYAENNQGSVTNPVRGINISVEANTYTENTPIRRCGTVPPNSVRNNIVFAENNITIRGRVIDYHSKAGIEGANVVLASNRTRTNSAVTDADGNFEITVLVLFDAIYIVHLDYLPMIIEGVNFNSLTNDFCFQISLFENPFLHYLGRELSRAERREYRNLRRIMAPRLRSETVGFWSGTPSHQFIRFVNLTNCE